MKIKVEVYLFHLFLDIKFKIVYNEFKIKEKAGIAMTLKQALEITLFKNHKIYIENDNQVFRIERLEDLEAFDLKDDISILNRGFISTTIKL